MLLRMVVEYKPNSHKYQVKHGSLHGYNKDTPFETKKLLLQRQFA